MSGKPDTPSTSVTPANVAQIVENLARVGLINLKVDLGTVVGSLRGIAFDDPGDLICWNAYVFIRGPPGPRLDELAARLDREAVTLHERDGGYQDAQRYEKTAAR